jgi:hypothetical protein
MIPVSAFTVCSHRIFVIQRTTFIYLFNLLYNHIRKYKDRNPFLKTMVFFKGKYCLSDVITNQKIITMKASSILKPAVFISAIAFVLGCQKIALSPSQLKSENATVSKQESLWQPFIGTDPKVIALPEVYTNYFTFSFDRTKGDDKYIGIRVKGQFGYARYMSYNLYDAEKASSFGAFPDTALVPDAGSVNPFKPYADPYATSRNYTLTVVPEGYAVSGSNVFTFNSDAINIATLMIRYYVPQSSETAGVPLPSIEAFDVRTGNPVPLPPTYSLQLPESVYTTRMSPIFRTAIDDTVRFYHAIGLGQFNNADVIYLISALKRLNNEVFLLRFRPPSFRPDGSTDPNNDVRYWSVTQIRRNTTATIGIKDADFKKAADGYVYVAIGDVNIKGKAKKAGYNFMPWLVQDTSMVLLYRNLLSDPSFAGYLGKVPVISMSSPKNIYIQNARNFIGDYAPQGIKMSRLTFIKNYGGWPAPGF